ncbi:MAG: PHP domain-containing protein [Prevotella sp.]|nr:PHP domain-containing protein [Staphylococcus sp.]MCM1349661.1 PHP domain-containing protein [Prevotella sp.]
MRKQLMKTNYHTHTYLCKHAIGDASDYVRRAVELQYDVIAITDHGPFTDELSRIVHSRRMSFEEYCHAYLPSLEYAKDSFGHRIKILSGIEIEYLHALDALYPQFLHDLDLLVLGQHYILDDDGTYKSVYDQLTSRQIEIYGNTIVEAIQTGMFVILAHPEIYAWDKDEFDESCQKVAEKIIDAAVKHHVVLEINANGIRNAIHFNKILDDGNDFPYPRRAFWKMAKAKGAMIVVNDDAHAPNRIQDQYTLQAYQFAAEEGISLLDFVDIQSFYSKRDE